jgi:predicted ribosome quality control (RQC) complex YloA/Tae2 family protein
MQPVDYTTLVASLKELRRDWLPARLEQVFQRDRFTVYLCLRTIERRGWLGICWHPQAARLCVGASPPKEPDTFTFSQQLLHQLKGLALVAFAEVTPWERVVDLQFAQRPGDPPLWHLYVEIMGKYSNAILTTADGTIVTAAHQVSAQQSRVRPIQTGDRYSLPPKLTEATPSLDEPFDRWWERVSLIPGGLSEQLLKTYRGLSSPLVRSLLVAADLDPRVTVSEVDQAAQQRLFGSWHRWLKALDTGEFAPGWTDTGYSVLGWQEQRSADSVQQLLDRYYGDRLNQDSFQRLLQQLRQKVANLAGKLRKKVAEFVDRLAQSTEAEGMRSRADLLMAHLHEWQPGMSVIALTDFETGQPVEITLDPAKTGVQNAQQLYKKYQKLDRSRSAIEPLLAAAREELAYLEQVEEALSEFDHYSGIDDLSALEEIRDELVQEGYLADPGYRRAVSDPGEGFRKFSTPSGYEIWIGRNNAQNDRLSFRLATAYDLWFHAQEIPGSHVLLRMPPGAVPDRPDLQYAADLAARYSRARQADQVPVIYTEPRHLYKPKGAKPGLVVYKHERVIWGEPNRSTSL